METELEKAVMAEYKEFIEPFEYYSGYKDSDGNTVTEVGSFAYMEYNYFEGFNVPQRIIKGKAEDFNIAYDRMTKYMDLPSSIKMALKNI